MIVWWAIGIFIIDLVAAYTWGKCVQAVEDKKALAAALWGGGLYIASSATVLSYNKNTWLLIPAVLGSMIGTYLSVKLKKDDSQN